MDFSSCYFAFLFCNAIAAASATASGAVVLNGRSGIYLTISVGVFIACMILAARVGVKAHRLMKGMDDVGKLRGQVDGLTKEIEGLRDELRRAREAE